MRRFHILWVLGLLLFLFTGCATEPPTPTPTLTPDVTPTATSTPRPAPVSAGRTIELTRPDDPSQQAFVRLINAASLSETVPSLNVYIEGLLVAGSLSLNGYTEPLGLLAGDYTLRVLPGGINLDQGEPIFQTPISLIGQQSLIYVLNGTPEALTLSTFIESTEPLNSDQSRVTLINAVSGSADISVQYEGGSLSAAFGQSSQPVVLPAGETTFTFSGIETPQTTNLQERGSYTFVLVGTSDNIQLVTARTSVPGLISVRAVNALASGEALDVYVGETSLAANLAFGRAGDRQQLVAQVQPVEVFSAGANRDTTEPLARGEINPLADESLSLVFVGEGEIVIYPEDISPTPPGETRVSFLNTISTAPRVYVATQTGPVEGIGDLNYAQQPQTASLSASNYTFFTYSSDEDAQQIEYAPDVQFETGLVYLYLLTGRIDEPPLILSESVGVVGETVDTSARVRFVNAVNSGDSVIFAVDGSPVTGNLNYSDGSPLLDLAVGDHVIEVKQGENTLTGLQITLETETSYSLYAYTDNESTVALFMLTEDASTTPSVRLVNLTSGVDSRFGLAVFPLTQPRPNIGRTAQSGVERRSMPIGAQSIANIDVANGSSSLSLPISTGAHEVYVVDMVQANIAATFGLVTFDPGQHYEIVVDQHPGSPQVDAFVIWYSDPGA